MKALCSSASTLLALTFSLYAAPPSRITSALDNAGTVRLARPVRPEVTPGNDRGPVDPSLRMDGVTMVIPPSPVQQSALDAFLEAQRDPTSIDFRHWLTPEEFASRFGASETDIDAIATWLRTQNLTVTEIGRGRNVITVSGTAANISRAFSVSIHRYQVNGVLHYANRTPPAIPAALAGIVTDISGLDDFKPEPNRARFSRIAPDYTASSGAHYLAPDDIAELYGVANFLHSGIDGSGQKIAIVGQTDIDVADIQAYQNKFNLPANNLQVILAGADPGTSSKDKVEAELDVEWASAVARNATLLYVNSYNVFTSAQFAVNQNLAPVLSMSYGGCEQQNSSSLRYLAQQANAQGITWVASSGDNGAAGCDSSSASVASAGLGVLIPASFPEVTAIGGTTLMEGSGTYWSSTNTVSAGSVFGYIPETSWNDTASRNQLSASGGGASIYYAKPSWQSGAGVPNDAARDVPDLSFTASPDHDGYLIVLNGSLGVIGGTSAPTPLFAGAVGLINQYLLANGAISKPGLGNINPTLYQLAAIAPSVFHDVTSGTNIVPCAIGTKDCATGSFGYSAGPGYDQVTGLGSVDLFQLATNWNNNLSGAGTTTGLAANPATIPQNATTLLTATVQPKKGTEVPAGTVIFNKGPLTLGTAALSPVGTATLSIQGSALALGANTLSATYSGSAGFTSSSASAVIAVTAGGVNSAVVASITPNPVIGSQGVWSFKITLTETAGQATTLSGFKINGADYTSSILLYFGTNAIPKAGSIYSYLRLGGLNPPANVAFTFSGIDPGSRAWTQTISVPFL